MESGEHTQVKNKIQRNTPSTYSKKKNQEDLSNKIINHFENSQLTDLKGLLKEEEIPVNTFQT